MIFVGVPRVRLMKLSETRNELASAARGNVTLPNVAVSELAVGALEFAHKAG
jgi:hypothetical protein